MKRYGVLVFGDVRGSPHIWPMLVEAESLDKAMEKARRRASRRGWRHLIVEIDEAVQDIKRSL